MKSYNFTIRLLGSVEAESPLDAESQNISRSGGLTPSMR